MHVPYYALIKSDPKTLKDMKARYYIILCIVALMGSACERTLDFVNTQEEQANDMTIDAIAVEGTPLLVYLSHAYAINKTPGMAYYDYRAGKFVRNDNTLDYQQNSYYRDNAIGYATVSVNVNGQNFEMAWNDNNKCYVSDYLPKAGDHIEIAATVRDRSGGIVPYEGFSEEVAPPQIAYAETTVPAKPKIEIVSHERVPENPYKYQGNLTFDTDTVMRLTCRITDTAGEKYYRLRVRGVRNNKSMQTWQGDGWETTAYTYYTMQDVFFSSDELFMDSRITANFGGWPAFFSNVFDNSLMQGRDYTFTVDSPMIPYSMVSTHEIDETLWHDPEVMVELQAISKELYLYLKSVQIYQVSENDAFSEPVQIYSNVQNGWGILGALSYDRHFVEYGE